MSQLAALLRSKYPGAYDDLSDEDLEKSVLDKHPEYSDLVDKKPQTETKSDNKPNEADAIITKAKEPIAEAINNDKDEQARKLQVLKEANAKPLNEPTTFTGGFAKSLVDQSKFNSDDLKGMLESAAHPKTAGDFLNLLLPSSLEAGGLFRGARSAPSDVGDAGKLEEIGNVAKQVLPEEASAIGDLDKAANSVKPRYRLNNDQTYTNLETGETRPIDFKTTNEPISLNRQLAEETVNKNAMARGTPEDIPNNPDAQNLEAERQSISASQNGNNLIPTKNAAPVFNPKNLKGLTGTIQDANAAEDVAKNSTERSALSNLVKNETGEVNLGSSKAEDILDKGPNPDAAPIIDSDLKKPSLISEVTNLPRAMQIGNLHFSAPLRQGLPLITSKAWWTSWDDMFKAYGSQAASDAIHEQIMSHPNFKRVTDYSGKEIPSFADRAGLQLTNDFSKREELLGSKLAEAIPGMKASNRAFKTYLNVLRADTFNSLIEDATKSGLNPHTSEPLAQEIAQFVNNATGRGSLGSLEKHAELLNNVLFAPRKIAGNIQMMNPANYLMGSPFVRKQYLKGLLSTAGAWATFAGAAKLGGAEVNLDPTNSDFGKIKIGNTRLDPAGGFQQYLVAATRLISGKQESSTTGRSVPLNKVFGGPTYGSVLDNFVSNKFNTPFKFAHDIAYASKGRTVNIPDATLRMFIPIIAQDVIDVAKEDPKLLPTVIPSAFGMSQQTYGRKGARSSVLPDFMNYKFPQ